MITNFEEITADLTAEEMKLIDILVSGFKNRTKENPIKEPEICKAINSNLSKYGIRTKLTGARLRKLVNVIRSSGKCPVIATSKGYYSSNDREEIERQIRSMRERASAISSAADGMEIYLS